MFFAVSLLAAQDKPDIVKLAWMTGCWEGQIGPVRIEEQWNKPAGGTMLGLSRNMKDGKVIFDATVAELAKVRDPYIREFLYLEPVS